MNVGDSVCWKELSVTGKASGIPREAIGTIIAAYEAPASMFAKTWNFIDVDFGDYGILKEQWEFDFETVGGDDPASLGS